MKRIAAISVSLLLTLLLAACSGAQPSSAAPASAAPVSTPQPAAPSPSAQVTPTPTPLPGGADGGVECDWSLGVDDKVVKKTPDGLAIEYVLVLSADKKGGTNEQGSYTGTAHLTMSFDASQMSKDMIKVLGGFNVDMTCADLTFDVVRYNVADFADFAAPKDLPGLAPLVAYDSMALISPTFTGTGSFEAFVQGAQGETGKVNKQTADGSTPIEMKIAIIGGQVSVTVPSLNLSESFDGMVTGTPK